MTTSEQALILDARVQLRRVLDDATPSEADVVRSALMTGEIDGGVYGAWLQYGCVLGTLGRERGLRGSAVGDFASRLDAQSVEDWADPIRPGQIPDHTQPTDSGPFRAALLVSWIDEWKAERT